MNAEISRELANWAYAISNCAIHDFRCEKLQKDSMLYKEIASKIDWYNEVTNKEYEEFKRNHPE